MLYDRWQPGPQTRTVGVPAEQRVGTGAPASLLHPQLCVQPPLRQHQHNSKPTGVLMGPLIRSTGKHVHGSVSRAPCPLDPRACASW